MSDITDDAEDRFYAEMEFPFLRKTTPEVPATNDPKPMDCGCKCSHLYHSECSETCIPTTTAEVPADEGTLRERLAADLETAGILPWTNGGQRLIATCESVLATELQKARAEVIDFIDGEWGLGNFDQIIKRARKQFAGGAS